jgi:arsenate reductase
MAEALLNHLGKDKFKGFSAGNAPAGIVDPRAIETLKRHGVPVGQPRSKSWNKFSRHAFDCVVAVCAEISEEAWPLFPGKPKKIYWDVPNPARAENGAAEAAFDKVFFLLKAKIERLIGEEA